jgi:hypothetical protein
MFPHEGGPQNPITLQTDTGPVTIPPPDYTNPNGMKLAFVDERLYFDYVASDLSANTLVYDSLTELWGVDVSAIVGNSPATVHAPNEGGVIGTLAGFLNGQVRMFVATADESVTMVLNTPYMDQKAPAWQHIQSLNLDYMAPNNPPSLVFIPDQGPSIPVIEAEDSANQIKAELIIPGPNKFKLMGTEHQGTGRSVESNLCL